MRKEGRKRAGARGLAPVYIALLGVLHSDLEVCFAPGRDTRHWAKRSENQLLRVFLLLELESRILGCSLLGVLVLFLWQGDDFLVWELDYHASVFTSYVWSPSSKCLKLKVWA